MRATIISTRQKRRLKRGNLLQGGSHIGAGANTGRIQFGANNDKIIVHHIQAFKPPTCFDKELFIVFGMHQKHIAIAVFGIFNGLSRAHSYHPDSDAGILRENRQKRV